MREVGVLEAKTRFSELLDAVEQGEEVTITRRGKAVATLSKVRSQLSGQELLEKSRRLREQFAERDPELAAMTWEQIKDLAHK